MRECFGERDTFLIERSPHLKTIIGPRLALKFSLMSIQCHDHWPGGGPPAPPVPRQRSIAP